MSIFIQPFQQLTIITASQPIEETSVETFFVLADTAVESRLNGVHVNLDEDIVELVELFDDKG